MRNPDPCTVPLLILALLALPTFLGVKAEAQCILTDCTATRAPVVDLPFRDAGATCLPANSLEHYGGCPLLGVEFPGPDAVYEIVLNEGNQVAFTLEMDDPVDLTLILLEECANGRRCVVHSQGVLGSGTERIPAASYPPGTYTLYVDSHLPPGTPGNCGPYRLNLTGINPLPTADLDLILDTLPRQAVAGRELEYRLTVLNRGPGNAQGVSVIHALPEDVQLLHTPPGCAACGRRIHCPLGGLAAGASRSLGVPVLVNSAARGSLRSVAAEGAVAVLDPVPDNNVEIKRTRIDTDVELQFGIAPPQIVENDDARCPNEIGLLAGCMARYSISVTNRGDSDATDVVITAQSKELQFPGGTEIWIDRIKPGRTRTANLSVFVGPQNRGAALLQVSVKSAEADPSSPVMRSTTIQARADVSLEKQGQALASDGKFIAGTEALYTFTVDNKGPSAILDGRVEDDLPVGLSLADPMDCSEPSSGRVECSFQDLLPKTPQSFQFTSLIDPFARGKLANAATLSVLSGEDTGSSPLTASPVTVEVEVDVDLAITKVGVPNPVVAGESVTYTMTVQNLGRSGSFGNLVTDTPGPGLSIAPLPTGCTRKPQNSVECSLDRLRGGESWSFTLEARVDPCREGAVINTATVEDDRDEDARTANNTVTPPASTSIIGSILALTKTASSEGEEPSDSVLAGDNLIYTLTVTNNSALNGAPQGEVVDRLPDGLSFVSSPDGCFEDDEGGVHCPFDSIPAGEAVDRRFVARVDPAFSGPALNSAQIRTAETCPEIPPLPTAVITESDLLLEKTASREVIALGMPDGITYTVTLTNRGPSNAEGVQWTDTLPQGVTLKGEVICTPSRADSVSFDCGGIAPCDVGALEAGSSVECTLAVDLPSALGDCQATACGLQRPATCRLNNTATVLGGNTASATTYLVDPAAGDLSLAMSTSHSPALSNNFLDLALSLTYVGPVGADVGATVTATLPVGIIDLEARGCAVTRLGGMPQEVMWSVQDLVQNPVRECTLRILVPQGVESPLQATARITTVTNARDPVCTNDTAGITVPVVDAPPLLLPFFTPEQSDPLLAVHNPDCLAAVRARLAIFDAEGVSQVEQELQLRPRQTRTLSLTSFMQEPGFVDLRVIDGPGDPPGPVRQILWGDFLRVNPGEGFASGELLVATDSRRRPPTLCRRWDTRFLNGGPFDGGTDFVFFVTGEPPEGRPLVEGEVYTETGFSVQTIQIADQGERAFLLSTTDLLDTQGFPLLANFGAIEWRFADGVVGNIATVFKARSGKFSVGVPGACTPATAAAAPQPPLLLPHFEVQPEGRTTLFAVRNGGEDPVALRYEIFSGAGELLAEHTPPDPLAGHGVDTVNLAEMVESGDGFVLVVPTADDPPPLFLSGDFFLVDGRDQSAAGSALVPLDPGSNPETKPPPLCREWSQRFFNGGGFQGATHFVFYLERVPVDARLRGTVYDEAGNQVRHLELPIPGRSFQLSSEDLDLGTEFGVIDWDLGGVKGHVSGILRAGGFSVDLPAVCRTP